MIKIISDFTNKIDSYNSMSQFTLKLGDNGGYLTFSNSGRRGDTKYFTLSLDSILHTLHDIKNNISLFMKAKSYDESKWRNLGPKYYTDTVVTTMSTVQTKPLFTTLSKLINWANDLTVSSSNIDEYMDISVAHIDNAIKSVTELVECYKPHNPSPASVLSSSIDFNISEFVDATLSAKLMFPVHIPYRFVASLLSKPFVILTGLSGSGKTKLAEAFSLWISEDPDSQICLVSVGADWTNREPLLGYPNALETGKYVKPDSAALDLILAAINNPESPHFLILDEMNMSHVERYFADFLSAMESGRRLIALHPDAPEWKDVDGNWKDGVPDKIELPKNLFIIGTVNIDETTYMFSPKVLDRAQVIEFRVSEKEMENFLVSPSPVDLDQLKGVGASMAADFVTKAKASHMIPADLQERMLPFFKELEKVGAEFGYRSAAEIARFISICGELSGDTMQPDDVIDAAVMQKLLPKLHGSRNRIEKKLKKLAQLCLKDREKESFKGDVSGSVLYPLSYEKLERMYHRVIADGFTSYAEA